VLVVTCSFVRDCIDELSNARTCAYVCSPQNLGDIYDMTPLFIASEHQHTNMVLELLKLGADPNYVRDQWMHTPSVATLLEKTALTTQLQLPGS
jgi:hypothetical protein